jgi:hypothetical protein
LSCGEPFVINPQWRKDKRDVRQAGCSLLVLVGVRFDRDLLKEDAFGSEIGFFRISDPGSPTHISESLVSTSNFWVKSTKIL